jgi:hypothetical protein
MRFMVYIYDQQFAPLVAPTAMLSSGSAPSPYGFAFPHPFLPPLELVGQDLNCTSIAWANV